MPPTKSLDFKIDEEIENIIDFWVECKQRDAEQGELDFDE